MRKSIFNKYHQLKFNNKSNITFYDKNNKVVKTYEQFYYDINLFISQIRKLNSQNNISNIVIIGPTSYAWMVMDWGCIIGGLKSIAVPEFLTQDKIERIIQDTIGHLVFVDKNLSEKIHLGNEIYYDPYTIQLFDFQNDKIDIAETSENLILEKYGIAFSSGTSENIKKINLSFNEIELVSITFYKKVLNFLIYYLNIFFKKEFKIIIYLPFSHRQQRDLALTAIMYNFNILLSDPKNCIKHLITDKPNIMVSVPIIYQVLANRIQDKILKFPSYKKNIFFIFNRLGINKLSNSNPIKFFFSNILFNDIKKLYGGKGDLFFCGSAPVDINTLKTFYSIGVKVCEGYGQSEIGNIAINTHKNFRLGSVGKPVQEIKISNDSEVLVKFNEKSFAGNKEILKINNENYVCTGDIGYLDKDGYLFLKGRKDDVIVLENGKKVFPEEIELIIKENSIVANSIVFSTNKIKLDVIISLATNGVHQRRNIIEFLERVNLKLGVHEKISRVYFTENSFTVENGLLTSTLKLRRNSIIERYKAEQFIKVN